MNQNNKNIMINGDAYGVVNAHEGSNIHQEMHLPPHKIPKVLTSKRGIIDPNFIGRDNELKQIDDLLDNGDTLLLVNGIGGIGKSLLASHYLNQNRDKFDYYGFIEVGDSIKSNFTSALSYSLDLKSEKLDDLFTESINKLQNLEGKTLLIIDNVKDIVSQKEEINSIIGLKKEHFKIIFASRNRISSIPNYTLGTLSPQYARELFLKYYKTKEIDKVDQILEYLDYHTLFITLIAKMVDNDGFELDTIITKFQNGELAKIKFTDEEDGQEKKLNKNLQELFSMQNLSKDYVLLLQRFSLFPSVEIDIKFLKEFFDTSRVEGKLNFLQSRGWLIKSNQNYKLHQIIKEYILSTHRPKFKKIEKQIDFLNDLIGQSDNIQTAVDIKSKLHYFESALKVLNILKLNTPIP